MNFLASSGNASKSTRPATVRGNPVPNNAFTVSSNVLCPAHCIAASPAEVSCCEEMAGMAAQPFLQLSIAFSPPVISYG
jgi:hypothetical protein